MRVETEGLVLKQVNTVNNRKILVLFTKKFGKISAGTNLGEGGKRKSNLGVRPFTHGRYDIYSNRDSYNVIRAETIKSYYSFGEDVDKYMNVSYLLEFTEKILSQQEPQQKIFNYLINVFDAMEKRKSKYSTLVIAYQMKVLKELGYMPNLDSCVICGTKEMLSYIDIRQGGCICENCERNSNSRKDALIYHDGLGIMDVMRYFIKMPLHNFEKIGLDENRTEVLRKIIDEFMEYHLDIRDLKSQGFLSKS